MSAEQQVVLHNRLAGKIVADIVKPPLEAGGSVNDILVLAESVMTGVMLACVRLGGDNAVLDAFVDGVRQRMAEIRLGDIAPKGTS